MQKKLPKCHRRNATEEATEMAAKYLHNKKMFLITWKKSHIIIITALKYIFIQKQYPENFTFLILVILELYAREVCKFLKK